MGDERWRGTVELGSPRRLAQQSELGSMLVDPLGQGRTILTSPGVTRCVIEYLLSSTLPIRLHFLHFLSGNPLHDLLFEFFVELRPCETLFLRHFDSQMIAKWLLMPLLHLRRPHRL